MELTRRDALAALAAAGAAVGGGMLLERRLDDVTPAERADRILPTLTAAAEVVYPSSVTGHEQFVETFVVGRIEDRETYLRGVDKTVIDLNDVARDWHDARFAALDRETRDGLLHQLDADTAEPDPDGIFAQRLRHYVVNELLYAFYSAPKGGRLVGIENPIGHPGGTESYQRATMSSESSASTESNRETDP